jgi:hypothetical protein
MSQTHVTIPFFTDDIGIFPHSATLASHLNKPMTIGEFAKGQRCHLVKIEETGELLATRQDGAYIEGREFEVNEPISEAG